MQESAITNQATQYISSRKWMEAIDDNTKLSELSIPGSHETMALYGLASFGQCQEMNLEDQLNLGIRFIDIRCKYSGQGDNANFEIYHGFLSQKATFEDVLNVVIKFLTDNPSETVLMRVKQEYSEIGDAEFNRAFKQYVQKNPNWFWDNGGKNYQIPKLKDIRGKIVVLYNVGGLNFGLSYPHNFTIQDEYQPNSQDDKWVLVKKHLDAAESDLSGNQIYLNYLSAAPVWNTPYGVAWGNAFTNGEGINVRARKHFDSKASIGTNHYGIIAMDYIRQSITESIILGNFYYRDEVIFDKTY